MRACFCSGPRPGHTLCPCRERSQTSEAAELYRLREENRRLREATATGKRCFAYCGDDRCNCGAAEELALMLLSAPAPPSDDDMRKPRFFPSSLGRQTA